MCYSINEVETKKTCTQKCETFKISVEQRLPDIHRFGYNSNSSE